MNIYKIFGFVRSASSAVCALGFVNVGQFNNPCWEIPAPFLV